MRRVLLCGVLAALCCALSAHDFNGSYKGAELDRLAMPVGGIGTGMFCFEGTGAISHMSVRHNPELFNEPCMFAVLSIKGRDDGARVLETRVPTYKIFGRHNGGLGVGETTLAF